jgi:NAD(P)-dependent dehydrogenase (short-subunit alcohol dehydrogenase family)
MSDFAGQVALVTGAGSGIGRETALALGRSGAIVVVAARTKEKITAVAKAISEAGGESNAIPFDVTSAASISDLVGEIQRAHGRLDVLVTCAAGAPASGPSESLAAADFEKLIQSDLTGTFLTCQAAGRLMLRQRYGRIVNLSSFHVVGTYPERVSYVVAKAGVVGMTQALAVEWGGRGITVNSVAPGPIRTDRTNWFLSQDPANEAGMIGRTPTGRLGETAEVAALIEFLCSKIAGHINGQTIVIDGGWTKNAWWGKHPWKA